MDNIYGFFLSLNFLSSAYNILLEEGPFRSLSLFGVLYSMECHIFLLYSVSWLEFVLGMQKKYFFKQHIYMCIIVVQCFNSNELKIVKNRLRGELHKLQRQT